MADYKRMAGEKQETQVAYFLDRYFGSDDSFRILNNLAIEVNGFNSQIDHLIIYKAGFIVVESKSIQGSVRVNSLASGKDPIKMNGSASPPRYSKPLCRLIISRLYSGKTAPSCSGSFWAYRKVFLYDSIKP